MALHISCQLLETSPDLTQGEGLSRVKWVWAYSSSGRGKEPVDQRKNEDGENKLNLSILGHIIFDSSTNVPPLIDCMYLFCDTAGYIRIMALIQAQIADGNTNSNVYQKVGIGFYQTASNTPINSFKK